MRKICGYCAAHKDKLPRTGLAKSAWAHHSAAPLRAVLRLMQPPIRAPGRDQLAMPPLFGDPVLIHDHDPVRILDRGEPVRDHQRRRPPRQIRQRALNGALRLGVQRRGRLVQDQDRPGSSGTSAQWPDAASARPRALPRARRSPCRARPAMPRWSRPSCARRAASRISRLIGAQPPIGDILAHRAAEQEHVLLNDADLPAQRGQSHPADIDPVNRDPPRIHLVETRQQRADRRLPRARWPDERHRLAGGDLQLDPSSTSRSAL